MILLIEPGIDTLRRTQLAGPSLGPVPWVLWMNAVDQTVAIERSLTQPTSPALCLVSQ